MDVNTSRNKSQNIVVSFYHAILAARLVQMSSKKKERSGPFSSATARRKEPIKSLSSDWTENLAESNIGLLLRSGAIAEGVERAAKRLMQHVGFPHQHLSAR